MKFIITLWSMGKTLMSSVNDRNSMSPALAVKQAYLIACTRVFLFFFFSSRACSASRAATATAGSKNFSGVAEAPCIALSSGILFPPYRFSITHGATKVTPNFAAPPTYAERRGRTVIDFARQRDARRRHVTYTMTFLWRHFRRDDRRSKTPSDGNIPLHGRPAYA